MIFHTCFAYDNQGEGIGCEKLTQIILYTSEHDYGAREGGAFSSLAILLCSCRARYIEGKDSLSHQGQLSLSIVARGHALCNSCTPELPGLAGGMDINLSGLDYARAPMAGWSVGFLTSSSTTRLYRGRAPRQSV